MKKTIYLLATMFAFGVSNYSHAQYIRTFAGGGSGGDGGSATAASLSSPSAVAADRSGNVYIADNGDQRVRKVSATGVITTYAGTGTSGYSGDGGAATAAQLSNIQGLATDAAGDLYISDWGNNVVRMVSTSGVISTVAGNATAGYSGDGAAATAAQLSGPFGLAVDATGDLYIADVTNNVVRMVDASGIISTVIGNGTLGFSGDGGAATSAKLNQPFGVAWSAGVLYVADAGNARIREVESGVIYTMAGNGLTGFLGDGGAAISAEFNNPYSIAVDKNGNMYVADMGNQRIRKIAASLAVSTITGNGGAGFSGDGGPATAATVNNPIGVAVDTNGNVFIADRDNSRVREIYGIASVAILGDTDVCVGHTTHLYDSASGGTWSSGTPSVATVGSSTGIVTGVSAGTAAITYLLPGGDGDIRSVVVSSCHTAVPLTQTTPDGISIAPNPANTTFRLTIASGIDVQADVTITDLTGRSIYHSFYPTNTSISLSPQLSPGVYLVRATTLHSTFTEKLILAR
jgi:sugar lactone lactonase YvrE